MKSFVIAFAAFVSFVGLAKPQRVAATIWNVPGDHASIQGAMDAASSGDTILVGPGTYNESVNFSGKGVSLQSTDGPGTTTIHPNSGRGATMGGAPAEIIGFTIRGGYAWIAGGVLSDGTGGLIQQCIFDGNSNQYGYWGAAIGGNVDSPIIRQNIFRNNHSNGDTQHLAGVVAFVNGSRPIIENNIFEDNPTRALNLRLSSSGYAAVINNTIVRNTVGIFANRGEYRNNIVIDNGLGVYTPPQVFENNLVFGNTTDYLDFADPTGTNGNISADPLFVDPLGDYRLIEGSPAIDAGSPVNAPLVDFLGTVRPLDGDDNGSFDFDIGAYEYFRLLTWDGAGAGYWDEPRWQPPSPLYPNDNTVAVVVNTAGNTVTVRHAESAKSLDIDAGKVAISTSASLAVAEDVKVAAGASLDVAGTLQALSLTSAGTTTLSNGGTVDADTISLHDLTAADGTQLVGDATVSGDLTVGNSIGTLNVDGSLTLNATSTYMWKLGEPSGDLVSVLGDLTLADGWKLEVIDGGVVSSFGDVLLFTCTGNMDLGQVVLDTRGVGGRGGNPGWQFDSPSVYASQGSVYLTGVQVVPEPSTFILSAIGLVGLLLFVWRKRRQA